MALVMRKLCFEYEIKFAESNVRILKQLKKFDRSVNAIRILSERKSNKSDVSIKITL